ncbi:MAG: apolipoprotein N-acyltransferase [Gammaproteobacteria bacterium]|nr:apolipoprotein N-acyltransferase [Gammaproteobacteria bacterium]
MTDSLHSITRAWRGDLLALLAGVLFPLAFAPVAWFPLALVSVALLFLTWLDVTPRRAWWRGYLFGLGQFGVGVSWVYVAIHDFGYAGVFLAAFLTALFVAFLALFPALMGYFAARFFPLPDNKKFLLAFPAAWTLFEWLRGWVLTGFPWLNIGYSQIDAPLAGIAPLLGVYGVSWMTAFSAALLIVLLRADKAGKLRALAALVLIWGGSALLGRVEWTQPLGAPLKVSLVQGNIPQDIKWQPEQRQHTLDLYADLTRQRWGDDLIVWPEAALTVFYHEVADSYLAQLRNEARAQGTDLIIGLSVADLETRRYYNSMMSLGMSEGFYFKRHLVPFGDYVPLAEWLRGLIKFFDLPMSGYSHGPEQQALLAAAGYKVGVSICYEDIFGEEIIEGLPEAALLVNGTNNAWYGDSFAPHQALQMSRMRALETGRYVLRATTNGISAIIDEQGKVRARSPQFETYVVTGKAQPRRGATPYVRGGNYPVLALLLLLFAWLLFARKIARFRAGSAT